jgi:hypothetical protein
MQRFDVRIVKDEIGGRNSGWNLPAPETIVVN